MAASIGGMREGVPSVFGRMRLISSSCSSASASGGGRALISLQARCHEDLTRHVAHYIFNVHSCRRSDFSEGALTRLSPHASHLPDHLHVIHRIMPFVLLVVVALCTADLQWQVVVLELSWWYYLLLLVGHAPASLRRGGLLI